MYKYKVLITWQTVIQDFEIYKKIFKKKKNKSRF